MKKIETEIVVAGGGTAGFAAAISAARMGHKVILIEKLAILGGLATAGNVFIYLPICDGHGKQLIYGVSEELLLASIKYGPGKVNDWQGYFNEKTNDWKKGEGRYMACFNPSSLVLAMNELLREAGVDIWYDTVVTNTIKEDKKITGIECYNKSGMHQINANCFIDATGDADLAVSSGVEYKIGTNRLAIWALEIRSNSNKDWSLCRVENNEKTMVGMSGKIMSEFVSDSQHEMLKHYKEKWKEKSFDRTNLYPIVLPTMADFRRTRAIIGKTNLNDDNYWTEFEDSVGVFQGSFYPDKKSKVWGLPFGTMISNKIENLIVAGRCIDSSGDCWDHTRLIPVTAQTGNIAGVAAALSIQLSKTPNTLPIKELQQELIKQGHLINLEQAYGQNWKQRQLAVSS